MIKHKSYNFKNIFLDEQIFNIDGNKIKAGYLNINGLLGGYHDQYFTSDKNLSNLDMMFLAETKLDIPVLMTRSKSVLITGIYWGDMI